VKTKDIRVFIIAVDGIPRNRKLIESLIKVFPNQNIFILDAIQPKDIDSIKMQKLTMKNKIMLGRKTTPNEIAVTESHNLCYKIAHKFEWQNIMIFEDDVLIEDNKSFIKILNSLPDSKIPLIRTFYSPKWGIWKMKNNVYQSVIPPAYAAAYIINASAIQIAIDQGSIGLADWPIWSNKIQFQFLENKTIKVSEVDSYLEKERANVKKQKLDYKQIFNPKFIVSINIFLRIKHQVFFPIIWKIYRFSRIKKLENINEPDASIFLN
jgi:GR25 family glycosyltransferase involved in LPS biosynthesis